jgi:membrane dipeptidase
MDQLTQPPFPIVDGHLDLAENVTLFGVDSTRSITEMRAGEQRVPWQATVSLPEMARGGIAVALATVTPGFLAEDVGSDFPPRSAIYNTAQEAEMQALKQIDLYERWEAQGRVRLIKSRRDLEDHLNLWQQDRVPGLVLLMESADPIVSVSDLPKWWQRGLRIIGLTYGDTQYGVGVAGGRKLDKPGRLTDAGIALLDRMAELGFAWDISHLAEDGVWQGLDRQFPRVCASHANARALTPTSRHLSDDVIRAIGERGGVIGLVLYNAFLDPRWRADKSIPVRLDDQFKRQAEYIAHLAGWQTVGIGSDLDGGFGLESSPQEINTIADLIKIGDVVPAKFRAGVLGENWLRFLREVLP